MLVGEATALVSLLGAALKFEGRLILQVKGDGPVPMMVADYVAGGGVRAMASIASGRREEVEAATGPDIKALLGSGHIAMTIDQGPDMERYQGVTPLEGESLAEAALGYFEQSEQIPTALKLAVGRVSAPGGEERWRAGGAIIQFIPGEGGTRERGEEVIFAEDDEEDWDRAVALMETTQPDELVDPSLSAEELLYRLYHEDGVRVFPAQDVKFYCSCSREKVAAVLDRYGPEDLEDMREADGAIRVVCEFCRTTYVFPEEGSGE